MSASTRRSGKVVQRGDRAAEALGDRAGAVGAAVGDEDRPHALVRQRLGGQLARLAGADDDDVAGGELGADQLAREADGDARDARPALAERGLRAHALAGLQRGGEEAVGQRAGRAGLQRGLVGALGLALDLGLADDHRLQAGDDAVELARGVAVARRVHRVGQLGRARARALGQPREQLGLGADGVTDEVDLGAVAGGDRDGLADRVGRDELLAEALRLGRRQGEPLAHGDRSGLVRDAEAEQLAAHTVVSSRRALGPARRPRSAR